MTSSYDIAISEPRWVDPSQSLSKERKIAFRNNTLFFALSLIVVIGCITLALLLTKGVSPYCLNVISHTVGHPWMQLLGVGNLILFAISSAFLYLSTRNLILNSARGSHLYLHLHNRLKRMLPFSADKFHSACVVQTMNVPKLSTLGGGGIRAKFLEMRRNFAQGIREALNREMVGSDHPDFEEAKEDILKHLHDYENTLVSSSEILEKTSRGICLAYICSVSKQILNGESIESVCQKYSYGGDEEMTALQFLYQTVPKTIMLRGSAILATQGLKLVPPKTMDEDGIYHASVDLSQGSHAILLQVRGNDAFVLDPNRFLIKFDKSAFQNNMQQFLGLYYSTAEKIPVENFDFKSFSIQFSVSKLALNDDSSAQYRVIFPQEREKGIIPPLLIWDTLES